MPGAVQQFKGIAHIHPWRSSPSKTNPSTSTGPGLPLERCLSPPIPASIPNICMTRRQAITSLVLAAPVAALAAAASLPAMEQAFQIRHYAKGFGFLLLAIVLGAFSLSASFDRTSSGRDAKQAVGRSSNEFRSIAQAKLNEAQADRRDAERRIKDEAHPSCNWPRYLKTKGCPKWGRAMADLKDAKTADY